MHFPFGQPDKTKDCGYRSLYYCLNLQESYEQWLNNFKMFAPVETGIYFTDICQVLKYYNRDYIFTQLSDQGLFIVYSGIWLLTDGDYGGEKKKHGHYFVINKGTIYCSTRHGPYKLPFETIIKRLECKTIDHAFRCLKVL